jgi:hypothetical protein
MEQQDQGLAHGNLRWDDEEDAVRNKIIPMDDLYIVSLTS